MNILFCHDGPINQDQEGRYYSIGFNDNLFSRYEEVFDKVRIITRVERGNSQYLYSEKDKLSTDRFNIVEYPNYLTLSGFFKSKSNSNKILINTIIQSDALIVRLPSFLGSKCIHFAKKFNRPYLIELVGCPWDSLRNHSTFGKILALFMYLITKNQVKGATDVLYVTNEFLQRRYPTIGRSVGCSDVELINDTYINNICKSKRNFNKKSFTIGTLGQISLKYKGHKTVIEAINTLQAKGINIRYQIAGPGDKTYLETIAKKYEVTDHICFVGPLNHDDVFKWFDDIDIYVQPSLVEGMPRALIEAMSRAKCCIASDAGGIPELLDASFIFKKGDALAFVHVIDRLSEKTIQEQQYRNYEKSKEFQRILLNNKRYKFYKDFMLKVINNDSKLKVLP